MDEGQTIEHYLQAKVSLEGLKWLGPSNDGLAFHPCANPFFGRRSGVTFRQTTRLGYLGRCLVLVSSFLYNTAI